MSALRQDTHGTMHSIEVTDHECHSLRDLIVSRGKERGTFAPSGGRRTRCCVANHGWVGEDRVKSILDAIDYKQHNQERRVKRTAYWSSDANALSHTWLQARERRLRHTFVLQFEVFFFEFEDALFEFGTDRFERRDFVLNFSNFGGK